MKKLFLIPFWVLCALAVPSNREPIQFTFEHETRLPVRLFNNGALVQNFAASEVFLIQTNAATLTNKFTAANGVTFTNIVTLHRFGITAKLLPIGFYNFTLTAVDTDGVESDPSNVAPHRVRPGSPNNLSVSLP